MSYAKRLKEAAHKQAVQDFKDLKWEVNERLAKIEPNDLSTVDLSLLNNIFHQIINKLKQNESS